MTLSLVSQAIEEKQRTMDRTSSTECCFASGESVTSNPVSVLFRIWEFSQRRGRKKILNLNVVEDTSISRRLTRKLRRPLVVLNNPKIDPLESVKI